MSNNNATEPAIPCNVDGFQYWGLTKREYIATQLMAGLYADPNLNEDENTIAKGAVDSADALLAELAKGEGQTDE